MFVSGWFAPVVSGVDSLVSATIAVPGSSTFGGGVTLVCSVLAAFLAFLKARWDEEDDDDDELDDDDDDDEDELDFDFFPLVPLAALVLLLLDVLVVLDWVILSNSSSFTDDAEDRDSPFFVPVWLGGGVTELDGIANWLETIGGGVGVGVGVVDVDVAVVELTPAAAVVEPLLVVELVTFDLAVSPPDSEVLLHKSNSISDMISDSNWLI